jgi:hypothetical protein
MRQKRHTPPIGALHLNRACEKCSVVRVTEWRDRFLIGAMNKQIIQKLASLAQTDSKIHGPYHWARVVKFGDRLADTIPLDRREMFCVQLFGWTHDLARVDDGADPAHGPAGRSAS